MIAQNREHLIELIDLAIEENGLECDLNFIDVSQVTDMSWLFGFNQFDDETFYDVSEEEFDEAHQKAQKRSLFNGDISQWNVSNVTNMRMMFFGSRFNGDISRWDVSHVTDMELMFFGSRFNGDISQWDVSNVTTMLSMFEHSQFKGDLSLWNVSGEAELDSMFAHSAIEWANDFPTWYRDAGLIDCVIAWNREELKKIVEAAIERKGNECDLNYIDVSNVTDMSELFLNSPFNGDISQWDVSNVTYMHEMFKNSQFNGDISQWDVSNVIGAGSMFENSQFEGDVRHWDLRNVVGMGYRDMFKGARCKYDELRAAAQLPEDDFDYYI